MSDPRKPSPLRRRFITYGAPDSPPLGLNRTCHKLHWLIERTRAIAALRTRKPYPGGTLFTRQNGTRRDRVRLGRLCQESSATRSKYRRDITSPRGTSCESVSCTRAMALFAEALLQNLRGVCRPPRRFQLDEGRDRLQVVLYAMVRLKDGSPSCSLAVSSSCLRRSAPGHELEFSVLLAISLRRAAGLA